MATNRTELQNLPRFLPSDMVVVGRFGRSVGLKGGIRITILTDFPEILLSGNVFYVAYTDSLSLLKYDATGKSSSHSNISRANDTIVQNKGVLITSIYNPTHTKDLKAYLPLTLKYLHTSKNVAEFQELTRREEAEILCNMFFYSTIDDTRELCALDEDEFFYFDIIGMHVVEDGVEIGIVKEIQEIANTHYFVLDKHFLIPYIDRYVLSIDLDKRQIITKDARFLRVVEH